MHRYVSPDAEPVLGWRPAIDQAVPGTEWVLIEKLGEGGFGEVWLGAHRTLKEKRVFKFCFRADRVRALKREVTLFRLLKERVGEHPNIVRLHEVFFEEAWCPSKWTRNCSNDTSQTCCSQMLAQTGRRKGKTLDEAATSSSSQ